MTHEEKILADHKQEVRTNFEKDWTMIKEELLEQKVNMDEKNFEMLKELSFLFYKRGWEKGYESILSKTMMSMVETNSSSLN